MARHKKTKAVWVEVARLGTKAERVALNGRHTVADALETAGINKKDTEEITVNGDDAEMDYQLEDGDKVLLTKNIEGGL